MLMRQEQLITDISDPARIECVKDQIHTLYKQTDSGIFVADPKCLYSDDVRSLGGFVVTPDAFNVFTNRDRDNGDWMYYLFQLILYVCESVKGVQLSETEMDIIEDIVIRSVMKNASGRNLIHDLINELSVYPEFDSLIDLCNHSWFSGDCAFLSFSELCKFNRLICLDTSALNEKYRQAASVFSIAFAQRLKDGYRQLGKEINIFLDFDIRILSEQMPFLMDRLLKTEESGK